MGPPSKSDAASVDLWKRLKQLREDSPKLPTRSDHSPRDITRNGEAIQAAAPATGEPSLQGKPTDSEFARDLGGQITSLLQGCSRPPVVKKKEDYTKEEQLEMGRKMDQ